MRKSARLILTTLVVALVAAAATLAQSQATTGVIEGTLSDESGAVLPGVTVVLTNTATNFEKVTVTNERGRFRALLLPLGPYTVTASFEGFATLVREGIQLTVGATVNLALTLRISGTEDEIVVTGEAPLVETTEAASSVRIDRATIDGIPNNGRNFLEFTRLTPGVSIVQGPDGEELTVNGQKGIQNNIMVDGADFNNPFFGEQRGGQRPAFTFNIDSVQEFVVVADGAPAEFGRASAGFVSVVTKSGTNDLSGTAHLFYQDDSLSTEAERADGTKEPKFDFERQQIGFTLGGPLKQDKTFFFLAFDYQDGESIKQRDPTRIEPRVVDALAALGSPNENAPIDRTDDSIAGLAKLDFATSSSDLLTLRFSYTEAEQDNGTFDVDSWGVSANAVEKDSSYAISGSFTSVLKDNIFNELRFQFAREDRPRPYDGPTFPGTDRPLPDTAFDFGRNYRFGMPFFIPVVYHDTRWQLNDNLSWLMDAHELKAGVEYNQTAAFQTFIGFANGRFIFGSTDGFLSYVENPNYVECSDGSSSGDGTCPEGSSITGPVLLYLQQAGVGSTTVEEAGTQTIIQEEPAVFIQDTWQPSANVTVQLGLRWEAQIEPNPITPASEVFYSDFIGRTQEGQVFLSDGEIPSDYDMWQPRFGLAWDPKGDGRTVIRVNAGLFYARIPGLALASSRSTNGSLGQTLFRNSELIPILGAPPPYDQILGPAQVGDPFRPDVFIFDEDFSNPRTTSAALAFEHQLGSNYSMLVKYNYAETDHLTRFANRNDPLLSADPSDGLGPWSTGLNGGPNGVGVLTTVESTASSRYQGLTVGLEKRAGTIQFQAYYTYSEDKSDDDNERDPFSFRYARITDLDAEWGYSDRDQRDRFNGWLLWQAPWGLNVNARYSYRSAQPQSITETGAVANTPQERINADGTVTQRNLGRKDNKFSSLDLRISKYFNAGDVRIEGIFETFNLFNGRNARAPEVTSLIFNFDGTVQSGLGDPRQFQLGLRFVF